MVRNGERLYFVILSAARFLNGLRRLAGITRAWVFGYETSLNARTVAPKTFGPIASAGVLLKRGNPDGRPIEVSIEFPEAILRLTPSRPL